MVNRRRLNGGFQNDVFYLEDENKVERISAKGKTMEMVQQEIDWMNFLSENGISLPKAELAKALREGRVKTSFEYVHGDSIDVRNPAHWNPALFKQFGQILGKMHALSKKFKVEHIHRLVWSGDHQDVFGIRDNLGVWVKAIYDELMKGLTHYPITEDTFGLIHNDFHQGNFIRRADGCITIIDFDDCAYNWFAQDIAVVFYHAYWQHTSLNGSSGNFIATFMEQFFMGYIEENNLPNAVVKQIPIFLKLREIFLYQLFLRKWDLENMEEWQSNTLQELENNIKEKVAYAGNTDFSVFL